MQQTQYTPLTREDVCSAVEGRNPSRIPCIYTQWWGEGLYEYLGESRLQDLSSRFPDDVIEITIEPLDFSAMKLSWDLPSGGAIDAAPILDDWAKLDEFIAKFPDPRSVLDRSFHVEAYQKAKRENRYLMFKMWRMFYERPWFIRGMSNLLTDYYTNPDEIHKLNRALTDLYIGHLKIFAEEFTPDGFWTSDDLGHQTQLMMPPEIFREFIKPYYYEIGKELRRLNMHWWLHSCGNNTDIMSDLVDVGVDMFHPVQKGCMDEVSIAKTYCGKIGFCVGIDVQHTLQEKNPDEIRLEVRNLIDLFDTAGGKMAIAAGNGIVGGTPFENIEAFLDEAVCYGHKHRSRY